ncbi:MAG TPA: DUF4149 domain-containing protein [Candidatus Dormibacteraeota bacterium]|jgi:uncharacterized membrane protein|nr:DUF4149 domain-containing protein [Candidatus Dormibacteraeota bacterium]
MTNILKFVQVFALGTWVGSIFYFSAAVAPGAFRVLPSQDLAGVLVEFTLRRLHTLGVAAGIVFLLASAALAVSASGSRRSVLLPTIGVAIMVVLTVISQHVVIRRMMELRREMGSVVATPVDSPLRAEFDRLHGVSVKLEGATLLIGFASLFLTVRSS